MRNKSENQKPLRPERKMSHGEIEAVLHDLTVQTKFRVWYDPPDQCGDELMEPFEAAASESGRPIDYIVRSISGHEDEEPLIECRVIDNESDGIKLLADETYNIWAIVVLELGLPAPESLYIYNGAFDFLADPAKDHVVIDDNEVDAADIQSIYDYLGRWLRATGRIS